MHEIIFFVCTKNRFQTKPYHLYQSREVVLTDMIPKQTSVSGQYIISVIGQPSRRQTLVKFSNQGPPYSSRGLLIKFSVYLGIRPVSVFSRNVANVWDCWEEMERISQISKTNWIEIVYDFSKMLLKLKKNMTLHYSNKVSNLDEVKYAVYTQVVHFNDKYFI